MSCRVCLVPLNTTHNNIHSVFDFVTIEGNRISIARALREIFPSLQEVSKLDVLCFPTYICDSCLKFLLVSYKFYVKCMKSNIKLQEILKEHDVKQKIELTNHFKYRLCCSHYKEISKLPKVHKEEIICGKIQNEKSPINSKLTKVQLEVSYSLNNEDTVFDYLQLQNRPFRKSEWVNHAIEINGINSQLFTNWKAIAEDSDLEKEPHMTIDQYDYEEELEKVAAFSDASIPESLHVFLEHKYSKFNFKYLCEICRLSFPEEKLLKSHIEICHIHPYIVNSGSTKYHCTECKKNFKIFVALREHLRLQHTWYKCNVCQKQFLGIGKFEVHVQKNHSGYRPFQCPICGKLFRTKLLFFEHEKYTHESEKPYKCKFCNKKWRKLINLDMHMRTHTGETALKCQDCDKVFDDADSLENHRKINHAIKKILHECDLCLAEFTNLGNLTKHMKTHKDYKPHCCVICDRHFPTLRHLKEHISIKHEEQKVLMCELCDKTYLNENDLIAHIENHAGEM